MDVRGNDPRRRRERDGRYAIEQRCDACGKPIHGEYFTDDEVCCGSDGPGFFLCGRKRCGARYESLPIEKRRELFTEQRTKNERT